MVKINCWKSISVVVLTIFCNGCVAHSLHPNRSANADALDELRIKYAALDFLLDDPEPEINWRATPTWKVPHGRRPKPLDSSNIKLEKCVAYIGAESQTEERALVTALRGPDRIVEPASILDPRLARSGVWNQDHQLYGRIFSIGNVRINGGVALAGVSYYMSVEGGGSYEIKLTKDLKANQWLVSEVSRVGAL